ncbi:uncharacterized protein [Magallana gigas]|uniref:uncharacterized protein n=1 Tax=Magallana gigas TaxID=29159 RepID=UPI0033425EB0
MQIFGVVVLGVLVMWTSGALVDFRRLCQSDQQSFGFRRDTGQSDAVHYCHVTGTQSTDCKQIDADGGFDCGEEFYLQGGLPGRQAQCCRMSGHRLMNCQTLAQRFSYRDGFDIMYVNRALRKLISTPIPSDPTTFQVELCDLEKQDTE